MVLGEGSRPEFLKKRVAYYVLGANEWKYADDLESIASKQVRFYLDSFKGRANDIYQSGKLVEEISKESGPDKYVYDPLEVRPAEFHRKMWPIT